MTATIGRLDIQERTQDGVPVVAVTGDLDLATAPQLCACLGTHRGERFVVDFSRVGFCDSTGLRALLGEARECAIMTGRSIIVAPSDGQVLRLFELTGLTDVLEITADVDAAVALLR